MNHPTFVKLQETGSINITDDIFPIEIGLEYYYKDEASMFGYLQFYFSFLLAKSMISMMQDSIDKTFDFYNNKQPGNFQDPAYFLTTTFFKIVSSKNYDLGIYEDDIVNLIFDNLLFAEFFDFSSKSKLFSTIADIEIEQEQILSTYPHQQKNFINKLLERGKILFTYPKNEETKNKRFIGTISSDSNILIYNLYGYFYDNLINDRTKKRIIDYTNRGIL